VVPSPEQRQPDPEPEFEPEFEPELEPELEPAFSDPSPEPEPQIDRDLESDVSDVLRQEAEREALLRAAEAETALESQPDLGLDNHPDEEPARRAREARDRMARRRGEDPAKVGPAPDTGSRRGLLPDIEEINSSLRASADKSTRTDLGPVQEAPPPRQRKSGFMRGVVVTLIIGLVLGMIYANAPQIAESLPQADPMLSSYVALVDQARLWLDAQAAGLIPAQ